MSHIITNIRRHWLLFLLGFLFLILLVFLFLFCLRPKKDSHVNEPPRDNTPVIYEPQAPGKIQWGNEVVSIDCSNGSSGYLVFTYTGSNPKVKFQIQTPEEITYTYPISQANVPMTFPLTGGDGTYSFRLLETLDPRDTRYAIAFQQEADIRISDPFLPYLTPNIYTQFTSTSDCIILGQTLALDCYCDLDVVENIYQYVIGNITYDQPKADSITYGYIPFPDDTLASGTGICFDYAALMTAMLRSQRIPTKLEVGYSGEVYHAWISCYVDEIGWVDHIIEFDGKNWSLMDPTLAANNSQKEVQKYMGDGSKYLVKYTY